MKTKYTAKTADGREFTRTSARTYTHASIVTYPNGYEAVSFAGSEELAHKAAASAFAVPNYLRQSPRAYAEESKRIAGIKAESKIEIVEVAS